jgi:hypothetical protein
LEEQDGQAINPYTTEEGAFFVTWLSAWRSLDPKVRAVRFPLTIIIIYLIIDFAGKKFNLAMSSWPLAVFFISLVLAVIVEVVIARLAPRSQS